MTALPPSRSRTHDLRDRVALVTLIDRDRRNAMTAKMVDEIVETFDALEADDNVGAVVLTGAAPAFCSGADVAALGSLSQQESDGERGDAAWGDPA